MRYLKRFNESIYGRGFTITGKIESSFPNGQKTPDFHLSSPNKTLSGTPIKFDRNINKYSVPQNVEVTIIGTTKDGSNPSWNNPIYVSKIEDVIINEGFVKKYNSFILVVENTELKCLNCESELKPGTKFCTKCGIKVGTKDEKSPERTKTESSFSLKIKKARDIISNQHDMTKGHDIFSDENRKKMEVSLRNLEEAYKDDSKKETSEKMLDSLIKFMIGYIEIFKEQSASHIKHKEEIQKKISSIEQENIDLKNKNDKSNKKTFDETFRPLLDNCKKIYQSLKDEKIKSKLNDLVNIVFKNYSDGNYYEAIGGASRLIVTFFADSKTFSGWNNKWTENNLDNTEILRVLDTYKKIIQEGK